MDSVVGQAYLRALGIQAHMFGQLLRGEPASFPRCCDLHGQHCEPPSELCCRWCPEVLHPNHPVGVDCVMDVEAT